jgi:3-hydroxyisobutyrate dehydrogenase-like beta-hydroxyacid dehydrogenase
MARVSVAGSGMMGSALTRAFLRAGHEVTVFDLDQTKTAALADFGAIVAETPAALVAEAEIFIPSLPTYDAIESFLGGEGVLSSLAGTTLVQLSSGPPHRVTEFAQLMSSNGIAYLEGRIKSYPGQVGKKGSKIIFSGDEQLFLSAQAVLAAVGEHLEYVSTSIEAVAALDEAVVTASYGQIFGLLMAAKFCQAHGISPMVFADIVRETTISNLDDTFSVAYPDIIAGEFRANNDTASIRTWASAGAETIQAIRIAGLDTAVLEGIQALLTGTVDKGLGDKAIGAIAESMAS